MTSATEIFEGSAEGTAVDARESGESAFAEDEEVGVDALEGHGGVDAEVGEGEFGIVEDFERDTSESVGWFRGIRHQAILRWR
jgi:hypothetical protein